MIRSLTILLLAVALTPVGSAPAAEPAADDLDSWLELGIARSRDKDWDGALAAYERVLAIDPSNAKAYNNIGNVQYRRGRIEDAAESYRRATEIDPGYVLARFNHGWMLRQLNRSDEAENVFRRCLGLTAEDDRDRKKQLDCLFYLGALRFRAQDYPAAIDAMERVLSVLPGHAEARHYLGMAYLRTGRETEGKQQLAIHKQMVRAARSASPPGTPARP